MNGIRLVATRELRAQTRTKGFIIGLIVTALIVVGAIVIPKLFDSDDPHRVGLVGASSQVLKPALEQLGGSRVEATSVDGDAQARKAITDGEAEVAIDLPNGKDLADGDVDPELEGVIQAAFQSVRAKQRLEETGIDPAKVQQALMVPKLQIESVTGDTRYDDAREAIAMLIVLSLFVLIISTAMAVAMSVVEEKSSRIVELLLIALRPWELLTGKILAAGVLGLVQLAVLAVAGLGSAAAVGLAPSLPPGTPGIVAGAFAGYLLGYAFFAAMAAALSSLVSRQEELGAVLGPMTTLMMSSYFVAFWAVGNPGSAVSEVLSVIPPFSSMVMPVRAAATEVPLWEIGLALVLMLAATAGMVRFGGMVYERAILRTGARLKFLRVLRGSTT